ncbi:hypothetical protein [Xenorhabdus hominickii]|uniref:Uncharacterized protein n=1 Tax=Xenorhabdus hominickii TaxID=351679 RepID=A0A2G0Q5U8_XENHO|nr:hypothetical protein [Xenorhabdus hominickii]PHM54597.1 hypothetical protein Xhom_02540 [Xenorhabdus hominickii]
MYYVIFLCGCTWTSENNIPKDSQEYIDNVEDCQHLADEWDNNLSDEQRKEVEDDIDKYCTKARELQKKLKEKYKNDTKKIEIMNYYDI